MADRIESNGSFYVEKGSFKYTGQKPSEIDQVVTYDYENGEVTSTDLSKLNGGASLCQYVSNPPSQDHVATNYRLVICGLIKKVS